MNLKLLLLAVFCVLLAGLVFPQEEIFYAKINWKSPDFFEHNQKANELEVLMQIFTIRGTIVKTIQMVVLSDGFRSDPIPWNGLDDYGDRLGKGVYIYKLMVKNRDGSFDEKLEKVVILR